MKVSEYLFKPFECQYESSWSSQCYNRLWYILCIICNPLTMAILSTIFMLTKSIGNLITLTISMIIIFVFNILQLSISEKIYEKHCNYLYEELTK
jgi:hypothetical protein